ncbi:membrane protein YqaA, SNARE-associated domain [Ruminobacter amylophilus]|uniref:Membrane protein YqaA, SNARE-associated domain n=1 Tax=Ruminobacter amylophilus TaxID=867 RepID=A0A662ZJH7_9GAMM|nr:VTT domain-containing protein [Ruminobacter amylophilus]SFP55381.1 membrane protein YqaA, SNARE-associated domain [Ruminobacter amylophilus]
MKLFEKCYDKCIELAQHKYAVWFLTGNSFIESIFWPIPVDIMLAPMCLANPARAYRFAFLATVSSVLGAIVGYYVGYYLYELFLVDWFNSLGWSEAVGTVQKYLQQFGIFFIVIGSFTPVPYKIVAICCGLAAANHNLDIPTWQLEIWMFILVSFLGRGARFYLIAMLLKLGGSRLAQKIRKYIDIIGWLTIAAAILFIGWYAVFRN